MVSWVARAAGVRLPRRGPRARPQAIDRSPGPALPVGKKATSSTGAPWSSVSVQEEACAHSPQDTRHTRSAAPLAALPSRARSSPHATHGERAHHRKPCAPLSGPVPSARAARPHLAGAQVPQAHSVVVAACGPHVAGGGRGRGGAHVVGVAVQAQELRASGHVPPAAQRAGVGRRARRRCCGGCTWFTAVCSSARRLAVGASSKTAAAIVRYGAPSSAYTASSTAASTL